MERHVTCETCVLYHPERPGRECSCFKTCCNYDNMCSAHIPGREPEEKKE